MPSRRNQSGELTALHKINHLLDLWETRAPVTCAYAC